MYVNCMFCQKDLGRNRVVEHFPVGRRLVFDGARGRLWVVCQKCERWNLTPLEERWEAVEECERLFRKTRIRAQTENMGLARHAEGVVLVRVGEPYREEFAAWRYGDQFGRRRRKAILTTAGVIVAGGAVLSAGLAAGIISGAVLGQSGNWVNLYVNGRTLTKIRATDGKLLKMKRPDILKTRLVESGDEQGWGIQVQKGKRTELYTGPEARLVAGQLLPHINAGGGKKSTVREAVSRIEEAGHPEALLRELSTWKHEGFWKETTGLVGKLAAPTKLALEMALHEEEERRALEGELWLLEQRWKEAEEIAAIADGLLLTDEDEAFLERHRKPA